ncbi:MAG TPA: hypothetical protein PKC54_16345 [Ferruginibacter sp.]|nr:hypothetical protein [Ferruginibacter sp.]
MRIFISTITFTILISCNNSGTQTIKDGQKGTPAIDTTKTIIKNNIAVSTDTTIISKSILTNRTVLVLPPYDPIANKGISPNIQKYIESIFTTDTTFRLIKFPYRRLKNISYQNVFDKKYCSPITDKIKTDIIIMSKLDQTIGTGDMTTDKWNFKVKIYNIRTGSQKMSNLNTNNLTSSEIENLIKSKQQELFNELNNNR